MFNKTKERKFVIIESPYKGISNNNNSREVGIKYARLCLKDSANRLEVPFASHLLYTQIYDDNNEEQRKLGIDLGLQWYKLADICAVYMDFGISSGMILGIQMANKYRIKIDYRIIL